MSGKKDKKVIPVKPKKPGKYDIIVDIDASFEDIIKAGLNFNPKQQKLADQKGTHKLQHSPFRIHP